MTRTKRFEVWVKEEDGDDFIDAFAFESDAQTFIDGLEDEGYYYEIRDSWQEEEEGEEEYDAFEAWLEKGDVEYHALKDDGLI